MNHALTLTLSSSKSRKEFFLLFFPVMFLLLSSSAMHFCNRLFLARFSIEALEVCTSTLSITVLFQIPIFRIISSIQALIGKCKGENAQEKMGPIIWQGVWICLLFFFLGLIVSFYGVPHFFSKNPLQTQASHYFRLLIPSLLFLPLGQVLAAFYLGQGQTKPIIHAALISHTVHIVCDMLLIFGVANVIPPLGLTGSAIATYIAQGLYVALLARSFLSSRERKVHRSHCFRIDKTILWHCLKLGLPRWVGRVITLASWAGVVQIFMRKGGADAALLSFSLSIQILFVYVMEALAQTVITQGSYAYGMKRIDLIKDLLKNSALLICLSSIVLAIPYLICPNWTIHLFFPHADKELLLPILRRCCYFSLILSIGQNIASVSHGLLTALQDTTFQMFYNLVASWLCNYAMVAYLIDVKGVSGEWVWLQIAGTDLLAASIYFTRAYYLCKKMKEKQASTQGPFSDSATPLHN